MQDFLVLATIAHSNAKVPIRCKAQKSNDALYLALQHCSQHGYDVVNLECIWLVVDVVNLC